MHFQVHSFVCIRGTFFIAVFIKYVYPLLGICGGHLIPSFVDAHAWHINDFPHPHFYVLSNHVFTVSLIEALIQIVVGILCCLYNTNILLNLNFVYKPRK